MEAACNQKERPHGQVTSKKLCAMVDVWRDYARKLISWRPGRLAQNAFYATFWLIIRNFVLALYMVAVARLLGPEGYGVVTAAIAFVGLFVPFSILGTDMVLLKHVSIDPHKLQTYTGKCIKVWAVTAPLLLIVVLLLNDRVLSGRISLQVTLPIALAEIVISPLNQYIGKSFMALERVGTLSFLDVIQAGLRLTVVGVFWCLSEQRIEYFCWFYLSATLAGLFVSIFFSRTLYRPLVSLAKLQLADLREGLPFFGLTFSSRVRSQIDRPILLSLTNSTTTGHYSAALSIADSASMPLLALTLSATPRLFRAGRSSLAGPSVQLRHLLPVMILTGILLGVALLLFAPLLPWLLGPSYAATADILRWIALLPLLQGVHHLLLTELMAGDEPGMRLAIEICGAIASLTLYILFVPRWGIQGAVLGYLSGYAITIVLGSVVIWLRSNVSEIRDRA